MVEHVFASKTSCILLHMGDDHDIAKLRMEYERQLAEEREKSEARIQAYANEFSRAIDEMSDDEQREFLVGLLPAARANFEFLLNHAKSESVQLSAIKYVFEGAIDRTEDPSAALNKLLEHLTHTPTAENQEA